jgi:hypothetical protein
MEIPLSNGFYVDESLPVALQQCTNWIPVNSQASTITQRALYGSAGIRQATTTGSDSTDANRGAWILDGIPYFVNGTGLYSLTRTFPSGVETFTANLLGTITGSGRVSMADNGTQLIIVVPGTPTVGYVYTVAGGLVTITDVDFTANGNPQFVVYIDGYFALSTDTKKWIVSALNDGTSYNALDFGSAEQDPDPIVAPIVHNNQIFLTGSRTTEGAQNIGGSGFPFQRNNVFLDKGCYAGFSLISTNQQFFMIGGGKNEKAAIYAYQGGGYVKISTPAIDKAIDGYSDAVIATAFSMAWSEKGQFYVAFVFTDRAFVWNMTTQLWNELKSGILNSVTTEVEQTRWRVNSMVTAYGYNLVGDSQDGRIGILDDGVYTEYSQNIIRVFNPPPLYNGGRPFRLPWVELVMENGVGDATTPEPIISMAISEDARLFDYERNRKIGPVGKYGQRTIWKKNGRFPRMGILQFRLSDPVKPVVIRLDARIK